MTRAVHRALDRYYPEDVRGVRFRDSTYAFYDWMAANIDARAVVLNVGAGPTPEPNRSLRGRVRRVIGVDPDPIVLTNTDLDEAHLNDGTHLPFRDGSFDAVYCDWTLEHVSEPDAFLAEVFRVLTPGADFWFRTTNRLHYVNFIAASTPQWFHRLVANRARGLESSAHEPWPTRYRMNREPTLSRMLTSAGFTKVEIRMMDSIPSYLVFHPVPFLVGVGYERLVNRLGVLRPLRHLMIGRATKCGIPILPRVERPTLHGAERQGACVS